MNIQSVVHDSIEDARTALRLYHKYQEMCKDGMDKVREALKELYETGRRLQWKVPEDPNILSPPMEAAKKAEAAQEEAATETSPSDNDAVKDKDSSGWLTM